MLSFILLATFNGILIGFSRAFNGRLSMSNGPFQASLCNHIIGFLFLAVVLYLVTGLSLELVKEQISGVPMALYLGGVIGAFYVAINSLVLAKLGAVKSALLVIGAQMIAGLVIDYFQNETSTSVLAAFAQLLGVALIIFGIYLSKEPSSSKAPNMQREINKEKV